MFNELKIEDVTSYFVSMILNIIFLSAIFSIGFLILKSLEKMKIYVKYKNKLTELFFNIISGLVMSSVGAWYLEYNEWNISAFIIILMAFSFFYKKSFIYGTFPLTILFIVLYFFNNYKIEGNEPFYYLLLNLLIYVSWFALSILSMFFKWKNNFIYIFISFNSLFLGAVISIPVVFTNSFGTVDSYFLFSFMVNFIFYIVIAFMPYAIFKLISRFISKTDKISKNILYKDNFIIETYANEAINNYLKDENINHALIIKVNIYGLDNLTAMHGSSYSSTIKKKVLEKLQSKLNKHNPLYYLQNNDTEYFFMIKINSLSKIDLNVITKGNDLNNRFSDDYLLFIQNTIKDTINDLKNEGIYITMKCFATIYGISSNDIVEINNNLKKLGDSYFGNHKNNVIYINTLDVTKYDKKSKSDILYEFGLFEPDAINIKLNKVKYKKKNYYAIEAISLKPFFTNKQEILNTAPNKNIRDALTCHISARAINEYAKGNQWDKNIKLILDYPKSIIEQSDFNVNEMISRICSHNLSIDKFCLGITCDNEGIDEQFLNNVSLIKSAGLDVALLDLKKTNTNPILTRTKMSQFEFVKYS